MPGGARQNSGRKRLPEHLKKHVKTFCLDKDVIDWLNDRYGRKCHAMVNDILKGRMEIEKQILGASGGQHGQED